MGVQRMKTKRVLLPMLGYFLDQPNGAARLAFDEAVYLAALGHEVWVVCHTAKDDQPEYSIENGLHILCYSTPSLHTFDPRRPRVHQLQVRTLLARYITSPIDIIHGHAPLQHAGALKILNGTTRICYSIHSPVSLEMLAAAHAGSQVKRLKARIAAYLTHRVERKCLAHAHCLIADSNYTRQLLGKLYGQSILSRIRVLPGWVDVERFQLVSDRNAGKQYLGWPTDVPILFTLRRLVPRMGLEHLLVAARKLKTSGQQFLLMIGGHGPLRERLEALTKTLELNDVVQFLGSVPEMTLPLMYAVADAFVLPTSELECFGLIALESLSCGRPVLATPVGAIPEIVNRVEPRWLATDASPESISRLLADFLAKRLPEHEPISIRNTIVRYYSKSTGLRDLSTAVLGE